jgi:hypothetical protein
MSPAISAADQGERRSPASARSRPTRPSPGERRDPPENLRRIGGRVLKRQTGPFRTESTPQPFRHGTNPVYVICNVQVSMLVPKTAKI